jgi:hypothetical protein
MGTKYHMKVIREGIRVSLAYTKPGEVLTRGILSVYSWKNIQYPYIHSLKRSGFTDMWKKVAQLILTEGKDTCRCDFR